ncbi:MULTISPECIES: AAA family ATPase [Nonomuraea]|uniref:AAA family ATPase n=1 Tax=Nonomuraea mangrovi TaxID=2316207 RepID=A0ABW4TE83_9ACTN
MHTCSCCTAGPRLVVFTGGPGSGKSTLIGRLGLFASEEAGRAIIQDQVAIGGFALPWKDVELFAELMLSHELRSYRLAASREGTVVFDRGVPDIAGYLRLEGRQVPAHVDAAARSFRYHRTVFVAPPWPEIYENDAERKQTPEEAERTYASVSSAYLDYGYELVELPRVPVEERVAFVLRHLRRA